MAPRRGRGLTAFPPVVAHPSSDVHLTAAEAHPLVAKFIAKTQKYPHYHPDSLLDPDGIQYGPKSGRSGGIVIHYLKRIEAGLRGEHLALETREELQVKFGEEEVPEFLPTSDDTRLDQIIGRKSILKRKRGVQEVEAWAEESSQAGVPPSSPPVQSQEEYAAEQEEWTGEVGERGGAPVVKQGGRPPALVTHDANGEVVVGKKASKLDKKAAKKLKVQEEKKAREEARRAEKEETEKKPEKKKQKKEEEAKTKDEKPQAVLSTKSETMTEEEKEAFRQQRKALKKQRKKDRKSLTSVKVEKEDSD